MRILWVKAGKLLPIDSGGKIRSYNILRVLAQGNDVCLLSYYGGQHDFQYEGRIRQEFPSADVIYTAAPDSSDLDRSLDYLYRLFQPIPYAVRKFSDKRVAESVRSHLAAKNFDVAVCDFLSASLNFPAFPDTPTLLFQHNVESTLWQRLAESESNLIKKLAFKVELMKMRRYEAGALNRFDHVIAVSEFDRQQMLTMAPGCAVSVVPTGVDLKGFAVAPPSRGNRLVFTGSMDWEPNIDAVEYFCRQILPLVRSRIPGAVLEIVGRDPHPRVRRLAAENVVVTGTVPSVQERIEPAAVVVVPLRVGGGTRLKIFEAMAMGKALVSTSVGAEGLELENGRDLMIADDPTAFADAVVLLLQNDALRRKYEEAALATARKHDWSVVVTQFADVLRKGRRPR